ncbi:hypothetical protein CQW23_23593 [Capsicum baccatum]|uniref:Bromo domain-containing protein n=1 Tax=Capsicum baccatum TaxID=33114 RepID=A0A2G2VSH2_CAPBA|nr:hypothetical protein CQW23_23593 [Capsicum baccatum]
MVAEAMEVGPRKKIWGTWEDLILGGAVIRHGIQDWNVVASELRSRTIRPYDFTPEACKAKYEDLQKRYSGCNAWFEELRKRRVEELKRELEKSESSIGSLLTKIESLKAEKERSSQIDYDGSASHTGSPAALVKLECVESVGKDGITAASVTLDSTRTIFSPVFESHAVTSAKEIDPKLECLESCEPDEVPNICKQSRDYQWKWRRGFGKKEKWHFGCCDQSIKPFTTEHNKGVLSRLMNDDLMAIFNSIIQNEAALVFMHRRSGQKRSRYKEMIKQHMDIETVRSRLVSCSIRSASELFRDLLLLATNSIIFYLKKTREYKAATALRDIITKTYHDHCKSSYHTATSSLITFSTRGNLPMKPRSARPRPSKFKLQSESCNKVNSLAEILGLDDHKPCDVNSEAPLKSLLAAKKGFKGHRKFECGSVDGTVNQRIRVPGEEGKEDTRPKTPVMEDCRSEVVTDERKRARKAMGSIPVLVKHFGRWTYEKNYEEYITDAILLNTSATFVELHDVLASHLSVDLTIKRILVEYQITLNAGQIEKHNNMSLKVFILQKKLIQDMNCLPLYVSILDKFVGSNLESSSICVVERGINCNNLETVINTTNEGALVVCENTKALDVFEMNPVEVIISDPHHKHIEED